MHSILDFGSWSFLSIEKFLVLTNFLNLYSNSKPLCIRLLKHTKIIQPMKHLNLFVVLSLLIATIACKTEPASETVNYKRTDNSVIVRIEADADNLNPLLAKSSYSIQVAEQLFLYLVNYNAETGEFVPELIKTLPQQSRVESGPYAGKLAYDFEILDEAVWDNGSPITGNDFLFTIKALFNPLVDAIRYRATLSGQIADVIVDANNPKKFTVYSDDQTISGLETISNTLMVLPEYAYDPNGLMKVFPLTDLFDEAKATALAEQNETIQTFAAQFNAPDNARTPAAIEGAGPYELVEWVTEQRISLRKKDNWWGDKIDKTSHPSLIAYPQEIVFKPIGNATTALAALRSEEIDAMGGIPNNEFEALQKDSIAGQRYNLSTNSLMQCYFLALNTNSPKLEDKRVRRALAIALDIDEVIEKVFLGYGERLAAPVHPSQAYYNKNLDILKQNQEEAKRLLAEAGWTDSNNDGILDKEIEGEQIDLTLEFLMSERESTRNAALLFQDQAKKVGIDIQPRPSPGSVLLGNWRSKQFEIASVGTTITPVWNPRQNWHSEGSNYSSFGNAETDALIDEILVTIDLEKRYQLYNQLQEYIYEEQPLIFLFAPETPIAIHKRFEAKSFSLSPGYQPRFFKLKEEFVN